MKTIKFKNKIIKTISSILVILILVPSILLSKPQKAEAFPTFDVITHFFTGSSAVSNAATSVQTTLGTSLKLKDVAKEILKQIIMTVERRLLAEMTKSMVNWINAGFHGSPLFLQNPDSFFRDIAKYEVKSLITLTGYDPNRFPFGRSMALSTINQFKRKFEDNAAYSLSVATTDPVLLSNLRNNFNFGGWNGFFLNSQYQQNNYVGYQMLYTEELARRLEGTANNNAQKVAKVLDQGAGFLSPQACPTNPKYNNGTNEFQRPSYKPLPYNPPAAVFERDPIYGISMETMASQIARQKYAEDWQKNDAQAQGFWKQTNTCPGGLVATTPGSVVGNQIVTAMSSNFRQTELGAALGSSMSAIFDALLNHFIGQGLSALASKVNPPPPNDDFSYEGQTLGSPITSTNSAWDAGPDEPVILDNFKKALLGRTERVARAGEVLGKDENGADIKAEGGEIISTIGNTNNGTYIPGDIDNTKTELAILDNTEENNPGVVQMISKTWPKIRELDMCIPGPDIGWQDRLITEMERNSQKLQEKANDQNGEKAAQAQLVFKELQDAVGAFKDWINNKMIASLPGSITYMDAVSSIKDLYQQSDEVTIQRKSRNETLARLEAIESALSSITTQPAKGSIEEKNLINLWKKYSDVRASISSTSTIESAKGILFTSKNNLKRITDLTTQCLTERRARGWGTTGGENSVFTSAPLGTCTRNSTPPLVTTNVIQQSCGNPSGTGSTSTNRFTYTWVANATQSNSPSGTEKNLFCDIPIKGGYKHGVFKQNITGPNYVITNPELPLVNGYDVLQYLNKIVAIFTLGIGGHRHVNIQLSCNIIYHANIVD
jgi:hypothetical protein